MTGTGF